MLLPPLTHHRWRDVVTGALAPNFEFLAVKLVLGQVQIALAKDRSAPAIDASAAKLRNLLEKNAHLPVAQRDLEKIFGGAR